MARHFIVKRNGKLEVQEKSFVRLGVELVKKSDFTSTLTQGDFTKNIKFLPTSPQL